MKRCAVKMIGGLLGLGLILVAQPSAAAPTVLTFDDLSGYLVPVPSTYDGFNFTEWLIDSTCSGAAPADGNCSAHGSVFPYQPKSLPTTIFQASTANSISSVGRTPFIFDGAYFSGFSGVQETFDLFLGGSLVGKSSTLTLNGTEVPAFLASGYSGKVDTVVVVSNLPLDAVMDNFTYQAAVTTVPEPATLSLLGLGLVGIGFMRKRKLR